MRRRTRRRCAVVGRERRGLSARRAAARRDDHRRPAADRACRGKRCRPSSARRGEGCLRVVRPRDDGAGRAAAAGRRLRVEVAGGVRSVPEHAARRDAGRVRSPRLSPACSRRYVAGSASDAQPRRAGSSRQSTLARRLDERLEQRPELAGSPEVLRVPLHADAERGVRLLDRLDHAVGGAGADDQPVAGPADRLMMPAVDAAAAGGVAVRRARRAAWFRRRPRCRGSRGPSAR